MHIYPLIFTLLLSFAGLVSAAIPASNPSVLPGSGIVTRCEMPVEFYDRHQYVSLDPVRSSYAVSSRIVLVRLDGSDHYDLLAGADSVSANGKLTQVQGNGNPVHLVLESDSGVEHFLFVLNQDNSGELLWSSATASALTTCTAEIE